MKGDIDFADNDCISHFGYDTGFVYERFEEEEIDAGDATFTWIVNQIAAGVFNPFIGQNAPPVGVAPIYDDAGNSNWARPRLIITFRAHRRLPISATHSSGIKLGSGT